MFIYANDIRAEKCKWERLKQSECICGAASDAAAFTFSPSPLALSRWAFDE